MDSIRTYLVGARVENIYFYDNPIPWHQRARSELSYETQVGVGTP